MVDPAPVAVVPGPQPGDLIPDFTAHTTDGRAIHRRGYKGRRHLVLCFVPAGAPELLAALAARYPGIRAEGGDLLVAIDGPPPPPAPDPPCPLAGDRDAAELRRRFAVAAPAALIVCDRYGEIVLRFDGEPAALPLDRALAALEWLQMRCSL